MLVINSLTEVERAGAGNAKEDALHSFQDRVFSGFDDGVPAESGRLFASKSHILSSRGVPYDATRYEAENLKVFKGGEPPVRDPRPRPGARPRVRNLEHHDQQHHLR